MITAIRARATDPLTSHLAAEYVERTKLAEVQKARVMRALRTAGRPVTSMELAAHSGIDRYAVARRLPELERQGAVERLHARRCSVSKRQALTWYLAPQQLKLNLKG